jgi:hypothetical protein
MRHRFQGIGRAVSTESDKRGRARCSGSRGYSSVPLSWRYSLGCGNWTIGRGMPIGSSRRSARSSFGWRRSATPSRDAYAPDRASETSSTLKRRSPVESVSDSDLIRFAITRRRRRCSSGSRRVELSRSDPSRRTTCLIKNAGDLHAILPRVARTRLPASRKRGVGR